MFIYQQVYCRYLCPGECIIHDRGSEFCNEVVRTLNQSFNVNVRVISPSRPQSNGQCEIYVGILKQKIRALVFESSDDLILPSNWQETIFHSALQIVRTDPSVAHGYAPAELLLGRQLVYPIEVATMDIDFTGTRLTKTHVDSLKRIRSENFETASKKIKIHQTKYTEKFNKKHRAVFPNLKIGDHVQYRNLRDKMRKGGKHKPFFYPLGSFYTVTKILKTRRVVELKNPRTNNVLKTKRHFSTLRIIKKKSRKRKR